MDERQWIIADHNADLWVENLDIGPKELGVPDCRVTKRRLKNGMSNGIDLLNVTCGELSFVVLPTRGMSLWNGSYKGLDLGWKSPIKGPIHPSFVATSDRGGLGWLQGFDEWIVRCGLDSNGAPGPDKVRDNNGNYITVDLNLHGKIANTPAYFVSITSNPLQETLQITGHVLESALFHPLLELQTTISVSPGSSRITVSDTILNRQATRAEFQLLYHCNFGPPFLSTGSRFLMPFNTMTPRDSRAKEDLPEDPVKALEFATTCMEPKSGYVEQVYYFKPSSLPGDTTSLAALVTADHCHAAVVRFDCQQLPCLTFWKNTAASEQGYVVGIEPATNYPNTRSVERQAGRVINLDPGSHYEAQLMFEVALGEEEVAGIEAEIGQIHELADGRFIPQCDSDSSLIAG